MIRNIFSLAVYGWWQLTDLKDETNQIMAFIPALKAHCAEFQKQVSSVVAKHGDIQFVFEHYLQVHTKSGGLAVMGLLSFSC